MKGSVRCGVVGVGSLGLHHARLYSQLDGCELVGVLDSDMARASEVAALYNCQAFETLDEIAANCDCVSVVTPTDKHAQVALPLLEKNVHLLVEKPMCFSLSDAERMCKEAEARSLILQVGHVEHYNPVMNFLEKVVNAPRFIATQRLAPFTPRGTDVSVVLDLMIHDIGIMMQLIKSEVIHMEAVGMRVLSNGEDIANARLHFKSGCIADIGASRISEKKVREIRVFQEDAYLSLDFMNQRGHLIKPADKIFRKLEIPIAKEEPLRVELLSFLNCVRSNSLPKVDAKFGKETLKIALKIEKILKKNSKNLPTN
ncbi:MAG: Gfo/Idh/MocA family oxidoreductase [Puniceicoccales bacterium]|jgi:predicted dehydrogenase|nr:Gfo/Idh/MocA family oxidoreductase [Puniceicoccales bacterium]